MSEIRIALAQINVTVGDLDGNLRKVCGRLSEASEAGAQLVVFPELAISGYPPEDLLLKPSFLRACRQSLEEIARACTGIIAIVGFPETADDLYNAAAVICDGKVIGSYRKQYLPNYGVFDEDRYFASSRKNLVWQTDGLKFGVSICEDMWYPAGPHEDQATVGGAELLINISASPYHKGKGRVRERMLAARATDAVATLVFCNLVGGQDELVFDGGSVAIDANGHILARGKQFAEDLVLVDIALDDVIRRRLHDPRRRKERLRHYPIDVHVEEVPLPIQLRKRQGPHMSTHLVEPPDEIAQIYEALVLGTRDYIQKNGFEKVVIGISGGIDSSLVACIAVDALGAEKVAGVSMPSRYSSAHSKDDAGKLAEALGIRLLTIPIETVHQAYLEIFAHVWPEGGVSIPDLTEENLQSRIRGTTLMALSNKLGWLVLTTGNKSESSVGYATLYGDMAGGFSVIRDVPKMLAYELARYRNSISTVIPKNVFLKPPSAELRPNQKDSDSLPPYEELDPILEAYVEEDKDICRIVRAGFDAMTVQRVVRMVDRAEYKRRQSAPGIKITPRAFGKDRRLPITNKFQEAWR